jgi:hypothetical protein
MNQNDKITEILVKECIRIWKKDPYKLIRLYELDPRQRCPLRAELPKALQKIGMRAPILVPGKPGLFRLATDYIEALDDTKRFDGHSLKQQQAKLTRLYAALAVEIQEGNDYARDVIQDAIDETREVIKRLKASADGVTDF